VKTFKTTIKTSFF